MTDRMIKVVCRVVPFKDVPNETLADLPHGHEYTVSWKNPNWEVLCNTIAGYMALMDDARFVKV